MVRESKGDAVRGKEIEFKKLKKEIKAFNLVSIGLKRFLDTDFTTKNYFRALDPRCGYRFHHLIKIKTYLNTTLIGQIRDKQVQNLK